MPIMKGFIKLSFKNTSYGKVTKVLIKIFVQVSFYGASKLCHIEHSASAVLSLLLNVPSFLP